MKQITSEWIAKAEADFATAQRELDATENPNHDAVCFHAQQSIEKYFKTFLQEADIPFPRTHDLSELLALTLSREPTWASMAADFEEAKEAFEKCQSVRVTIRQSLHL